MWSSSGPSSSHFKILVSGFKNKFQVGVVWMRFYLPTCKPKTNFFPVTSFVPPTKCDQLYQLHAYTHNLKKKKKKIAYLKHVLKTRIACLISSPPHPQIIIRRNSYVIINNPDFFPQTSISNPSQRKIIISNFKLKIRIKK